MCSMRVRLGALLGQVPLMTSRVPLFGGAVWLVGFCGE